MKVLKFGGSSVGSTAGLERVVRIIADARKYGDVASVVVSAFNGVTDQLIQLGSLAASGDDGYKSILDGIQKRHEDIITAMVSVKEKSALSAAVRQLTVELGDTVHGISLVRDMTPKTQDFISSFGERLSATVLAGVLRSNKIEAEYLDMRPLIKTDGQFGSARVDLETTYGKIRDHFSRHNVLQVATGFIGSSSKNETTTLGRGGSDYTAALVGAALKSNEVEIWTDVDGFMTADPRKVKKVFSIESLSYEEAMELSHFGAKVIYPPTLQPTSSQSIPVRVKNTFHPEFGGTVIGHRSESAFLVTGISSIDQIALLRIEGSGLIGVAGISGRLFSALAKNGISVILISQASSEHSICFAVAPQTAEAAQKAIADEFRLEMLAGQVADPVVIERNLSIVAVVGENMRKMPGISGRLFQALGKNGVNVVAIAQGSSELNISVVVPQADESKALNALHEAFFLSQTKTLNLYLLGTGLIGGTLLKQMHRQAKNLAGSYDLEIKLAGLGNIDKMVFDENGLDLSSWQKVVENGEPIRLNRFLEKIKALNLPNAVFVDCTGSGDVIELYEDILCSNISIVTPNKIANSGGYARYKRLKDCAARHSVKFLYETNVGAGLPVINTLNDLLASGDTIFKIEAVLSGTLSYIFNTVAKNRPFSAVVMEAKNAGLSEPDPRTDLTGLDVARKILILSRETGLMLEPEDVVLEPILSQACIKAGTLEAFFRQLESEDPVFEQKRSLLEKKNQRLRYIASLEGGKASVALKSVGSDDPFYSLSGSDNMIVFTTERYHNRPLVVKGPGAGAEVTAAGVFADILRIANYLS
jgi:aspartokinase/homoserine dehydrogenase 1